MPLIAIILPFAQQRFAASWPLAILCILITLTSSGQEPAQTGLAFTGPEQRIGQLAAAGRALYRNYPTALPSLLQHIKEKTTFNVVTEPLLLEDFSDPAIKDCPFIYVNFADRAEWLFSEAESEALRKYLTLGGFIYIDAGITASFLREQPELGQHHSYAEWEASPEIKTAFQAVFPGLTFQPLKRSDPLFAAFYQGLPDTSLLPETVRNYTEQEKWPNGTYSAAALRLNGRIAVLVTPIVAMGWGKNSLQQWETTIRFRILEGAEGLQKLLPTAAYSGPRFEVAREDGGKDSIYCQDGALPAWAHEPGDKWRVFRYYSSQEISDFAHLFYTRLGTNIIIHALTN